jgi:hypothetical protein
MGRVDENYYYTESLDDIKHNIECLDWMCAFESRNRHTAFEGTFTETIELLKKEQKILAKQHNIDYNDDIDVRIMTEAIRGIGMSKDTANKLINHILKSNIRLSEAEEKFIESISQSNYKSLTQKQDKWLKDIYGRTI